MWSRWDMQDHPPDILITNYSMLNIMLMRGVEASIFDQTRQWLQADPSHVFHLVVDELHTYRGTPGTEVAYLIRVLLDRIGLPPDSDQLRIIASSASVASGAAGLQYLEAFFGRDRNRFRIVGGTPQPLNPARLPRCVRTRPRCGSSATILRASPSLTAADGDCVPDRCRRARSAGRSKPGVDARLGARAHHGRRRAAPGMCRRARTTLLNWSRGSPSKSRRRCFPASRSATASRRSKGFSPDLSAARGASGTAPLPVRAHIIFRNLQGLWVCTNPACTQAPPRNGAAPCRARFTTFRRSRADAARAFLSCSTAKRAARSSSAATGRDTGLNPERVVPQPGPSRSRSVAGHGVARSRLPPICGVLAWSAGPSARIAAMDAGQRASAPGEPRASPGRRQGRARRPGLPLLRAGDALRRIRPPATARDRRIPRVARDVTPTGRAARSAHRSALCGPASRRSRRFSRTRSCATSRPPARASRASWWCSPIAGRTPRSSRPACASRTTGMRSAKRSPSAIAVQGAGAQAFAAQVGGQPFSPAAAGARRRVQRHAPSGSGDALDGREPGDCAVAVALAPWSHLPAGGAADPHARGAGAVPHRAALGRCVGAAARQRNKPRRLHSGRAVDDSANKAGQLARPLRLGAAGTDSAAREPRRN